MLKKQILLLAMWKSVVQLNTFVKTLINYQDTLMNRKFKERPLFELVFCNINILLSFLINELHSFWINIIIPFKKSDWPQTFEWQVSIRQKSQLTFFCIFSLLCFSKEFDKDCFHCGAVECNINHTSCNSEFATGLWPQSLSLCESSSCTLGPRASQSALDLTHTPTRTGLCVSWK